MYHVFPKKRSNIQQENENNPVNTVKRVADAQRYREPLLALPTNQALQKRRAKSTSEDERKQSQLYNNCKATVDSPYGNRTKYVRGFTTHHSYKVLSPYSKWIKKTTTVTTEEVFVDAREYGDDQPNKLSQISVKQPLSSSTYAINCATSNIPKPPAIKRTLTHRNSRYKPRHDLFVEDVFYSAYLMETIQHFKSVELKHFVSSTFLQSDPTIIKNRKLVLNWLQQLHQEFAMGPTVFFITVRLFDKTLSSKKVPMHLYQLVAIVIMSIVNKIDCSTKIEVSKFLRCCYNVHTAYEFQQMELKLLKLFDFDIILPDPITFVCYYLKLLHVEDQFKVLVSCATYVLESFSLHQNSSCFTPSFQAAAATYLSVRTLYPNFYYWDILKDYPGYYTAQDIETLKILMAVAVRDQQNPNCKCREPFFKYSVADFYNVSLVFGDKLAQ